MLISLNVLIPNYGHILILWYKFALISSADKNQFAYGNEFFKKTKQKNTGGTHTQITSER